MLERPPREREWLSWLYVALWTLLIFLTIPFARDLIDYVDNEWGPKALTYGGGVIMVFAAIATLVVVAKRPHMKLVNYASLLGVAGLFAYLIILLGVHKPEEAFHYLEYGLLSLLIYRAFTHRIRDYSIYIAVVIVGTIVGMLDESIQWITPHRYFDFSDIWLNFSALALVQLALVTGIRPKLITGWPDAASLRRLCNLGALTIALLALCGLNTPDRMAWYAERIPLLGFMQENRGVMAEYGYLHEDAEVGLFRSRLTIEELLRSAEERAAEGARILDQYWDRKQYWAFLRIYNSTKDPFLHEARVHLFRRNIHVQRGDDAEDEETRREKHTVAYWENRILEKYFGPLLQASSYVWSAEVKAKVEAATDRGSTYESPVSRRLITKVNQQQFLWFSIGAFLGLILLGQYFGKRVSG